VRNRKDHYIPQGYLRGFIDPARRNNDKPLWCLNKLYNQWETRSTTQICCREGMFDFSGDAIAAEHPDQTFGRMENDFPDIRDKLVQTKFITWREHKDFLLRYMQMIRVRSPAYFVQKGDDLSNSLVATITSVDHAANKTTIDSPRRLSAAEIKNMTLANMQYEFRQGVAWMADFHWQVKITSDTHDPVVTSETPLFVEGRKQQTERIVTWDLLEDNATQIWFPLCWSAVLVGRKRPFDTDLESFDQSSLTGLRHIICEMTPKYVISPQIVKDLVLTGKPAPGVSSRSARM
jgi:hypothetical protein